ncbi:MAG TPA: winged helix-turn-helix domain-containing protein, partial [Pirellulaceae bacterium]|nr:winged helix-turn-helix domain-containing protein [Pirellulaceae bacterium]
TKTKTTKATTTARNAKKATKAQTAKAATKNTPVAKRDAKESKPDGKKISQIEAAIIVLGKSKDAMNCKAMVEAMQVAGLWSSQKGATPDATLYASILREINAKGKDARFRKTERGNFTLASRK